MNLFRDMSTRRTKSGKLQKKTLIKQMMNNKRTKKQIFKDVILSVQESWHLGRPRGGVLHIILTAPRQRQWMEIGMFNTSWNYSIMPTKTTAHTSSSQL